MISKSPYPAFVSRRRFAVLSDMKPTICIDISGIIATRATVPNASETTFPPTEKLAPIIKRSMKVAVIGPEATPPESNAIAV